MMKMDGRDSAKCRKSKLGDINDIIKFVLNNNKTNWRIMFISLNKRPKENVQGRDFLDSELTYSF